jgi:hypothetical protein
LKELPKVVRTFEEFTLVDQYTGDSDPVYWAVARARHVWGYGWATRFCVAMLAYYHTGTALQAAEKEGEDFWKFLANVYPKASRGSERRHFRGTAGLKALIAMQHLSLDPDKWFQEFPQTYKGVVNICETTLKHFGAYFQLKICDYMDRCLTMPIQDWSGLEKNLPTEPAKALQRMAPDGGFLRLVERCRQAEILASPLFERLVSPAEIETALCGWFTTKYKGNWFGADVLDKREAAVGYGPRSKEFVDMFPPVPDKGLFLIQLE